MSENSTTNNQQSFFEHLKKHLPENLMLANVVSQVLSMSLNEAYKKIRGTSALSFAQTDLLCRKLDFSYCFQPENSNTISFSALKSDSSSPNLKAYLADLLVQLQTIHNKKTKHIKLTTDDIPLFHFFKYPELTAFKLFFWADSIDASNNSFADFNLDEETLELVKKLNQLYLEIPCTEIWSKDTVQGTIDQIRYAFEAGYLSNKESIIKILEQLKSCLTDINMYAISQKKTVDPSHIFNWYACDVLGSICYLVDVADTLACYNRFNTFGYLKTENISYCAETSKWMNGLIRKSISFSGHGEKQRNKYLYTSYAEIDGLMEDISSDFNIK